MNKDEWNNLKRGDIIRHKSGSASFIVSQNIESQVTAVRVRNLHNPDEWILFEGLEVVLPDPNSLRELLADYAHDAWSSWMKYLFEKCIHHKGEVIIPESLVKRWARQLVTHYADLSEKEKDNDRDQADVIMELVYEHLMEKMFEVFLK